VRALRWLGLLVAIYAAAYVAFRELNTEVWEKDRQAYVIVPESAPWLYYAFRPIALLDARLTGMRFHIGPHR
jgi:hypothetical protein